jgi:hypothetical protein
MTEWYPRPARRRQSHPRRTSPQSPVTLAWNGVRITPDATAAYPIRERAEPLTMRRARDGRPSPITHESRAQTREDSCSTGACASFSRSDRRARPSVDAGQGAGWRTRAAKFRGWCCSRIAAGPSAYRIASAPHGATTNRRTLHSARHSESLSADLERMLVEQGLFNAEAKAMIATWRDSWFEEGTRVFYLLPQAAVDATLPLSINPVPSRNRARVRGPPELAHAGDSSLTSRRRCAPATSRRCLPVRPLPSSRSRCQGQVGRRHRHGRCVRESCAGSWRRTGTIGLPAANPLTPRTAVLDEWKTTARGFRLRAVRRQAAAQDRASHRYRAFGRSQRPAGQPSLRRIADSARWKWPST